VSKKVVEFQKLLKFVVDIFLFEFVYSLKQSIYTKLVIIYSQQSYNIDMK
jgi:hypothetical protein